MFKHPKAVTSLTAIALLGLSVTCVAGADPDRYERRTQAEVRSCIAEIAKRADYEGASRVVHLVKDLRQKNLVEVELRIITSVYFEGTADETRQYETSCVVAQLGEVVDIRVRS